MNYKTLFSAILVSQNILTGAACASTEPAPTVVQNSSNSFPFYAGISGGFENLTGDRTDQFISLSPLGESRTFSDNKRLSSRSDVTLSAIAGVLWRIPNLPLSIGPEIYIGQGKGSDTIKDTYVDNINGEARTYTADLKRKLFYGIIVRTGWNFWKEYFGFISLGIDCSQFMTDRLMITDTRRTPNLNTIRRTKRLTGFVAGIGIEKRFGSFCVGMDFKRIAYKQQNSLDTLRPDPGVLPTNQLGFSAKPRIYSLSLRISYFF